MRYLILLLLLANIVFFMLPKDSQRTFHGYTRGAAQIPMLVTLDEKNAPPAPASAVPLLYTGVTLAPGNGATAEVTGHPAGTSEPVDEASAVEIAGTESEAVSANLDEEQSQSEAENSAADARKRAAALAAIKSQGKFDKTAEVGIGSVEPPQTIVRGPLKCYTLGPFDDKKMVNDFIAKMVKKGVKPALRSSKSKKPSGYWVYLPPYPTRKKALEVADHLASIGFSDYFIVGEPKRNNAISLGLFSRKAGSQQRVRDLQEMGFKAKVETRYSESDVFWIDYESYSEIDWAPLIKEYKDAGDIENKTRACER